MGRTFWERLNYRNFLSTLIFGGYLWILREVFNKPEILTENTVLALLLGTYTALVTALGVFYYRKSQTKAEPTS